MPVTFQFNANDVKYPEYVSQVPLDALFKNMGYKQSDYDQSYQQAQQVVNSLKVPASGQDVAERDRINNQMNEKLKQFAGASLTDKNTFNQFTSYVNELSQNPELHGIYSRDALSKKMSAEKQKAEEKGDIYFNKGYDQAKKYYSSGVYDPNASFTDNPGIVPSNTQLMKDILATTTKSKIEVEDPVTHEKHTVEYYKPEDLKASRDAILSTTKDYRKYQEYLFNQQTEGVTDWNKTAAEMYQPHIDVIDTNLNLIQTLDNNARKKNDFAGMKKYAEAYKQNKALRDSYVSAAQGNPELVKMKVFQTFAKKMDDGLVSSLDAQQNSDSHLDEAYKLNKQYQHDFAVMAQDQKYKLELQDAKQNAALAGQPTNDTSAIIKNFYDLAVKGAYDPSSTIKDDKTGNPKVFSGSDIASISPSIGNKVGLLGGDKDWVQYSDNIPAVDAHASKMSTTTNETGTHTTIQRGNIQTDENGHLMQFINTKTHQIAYVEYLGNEKNKINIINYNTLAAQQAAVEQEKSPKNRVTVFPTIPAYEKAESDRVAKEAAKAKAEADKTVNNKTVANKWYKLNGKAYIGSDLIKQGYDLKTLVEVQKPQ